MGFKLRNALFWVFYLWIVSGKCKSFVRVLYAVESKICLFDFVRSAICNAITEV